jgi:hypothetical protein
MGAPLGFKTFVTGDVLTAADTNGYLMQGIWVFANATARDAAVTSPQEGNSCYLKDTDNIMVYSGSAWVTKSVTATSSGLTLVKTVSFSASSSIDLSDSFSTTYDNYMVQGSFTSSADGDLLFRYRVGGADNSTTNYNYQIADIDGTGQSNTRLTGQTSGRLCATRTGSVRSSVTAQVYQPFASNTKNWVGHASIQTGTATYINQISGGFNTTTSFTGLTVYPSSGNVTGTFRVYAYANS